MSEPTRLTYRAAGVDLDAASRHTEAIAELVRGGVSRFAGQVPLPAMAEPVLLAATDGVGTKLLLALELGRVDGLGQDLVAMCVNDLACAGAQPIGFLDYLAMGRIDPERSSAIVASIARACERIGCPLVGGETAEMPGLYAASHFDLAGFAIGAVERADLLGPEQVAVGDLIVGIDSSGLHSNGFSLVRRLVQEGALRPDPDLLLEPTRLYVDDLARLRAARVEVHAAAHVTGGGIPENLPRALPDGARAVLHPDAWTVGEAIEAVLATERVEPGDAWKTFNMGLGMCLVLGQEAAEAACAILSDARVVGYVEAGSGGVRFA
jgi:phosphoribosylformylglycinamidine cyclo-ligase